MVKIIFTDKAPAPVGPYSQGILIDDFNCLSGESCSLLFISGMVPIDPSSGRVVEGPFEEQARRTLMNLRAVVEAAGGTLNDVVKVTAFLKDISNFDRFNKIYSEFFEEHKPARTVIEAKPPKNFEVEVEAIAFIRRQHKA